MFAQVRGGEERGGEAREGEERRGEGRGGEGRKGEQIGLWGTVFHSWPHHPPIQALCCCQDLRRGKKIGLRGGCATPHRPPLLLQRSADGNSSISIFV